MAAFIEYQNTYIDLEKLVKIEFVSVGPVHSIRFFWPNGKDIVLPIQHDSATAKAILRWLDENRIDGGIR